MKLTEDQLFENEEVEMEMEVEEGMELELDGDEMEEMEELVQEKVLMEEKENKAQKRKRGPKPGSNIKEKSETSKAKSKVVDLSDIRTLESYIKRGKISAPCFRIEKVDADNTYDLLMAPGVIFPKDAKYEKYDNVPKMNDGKWMVTLKAVEVLGTEKFKAMSEDGQEVEHDYVRYELHKPGREKDVVEIMSVRDAKNKQKAIMDDLKKKEERAKKKEQKEKAE